MSVVTKTSSVVTKASKKPKVEKPTIRTRLTMSQKAESIALWRSGTVTLEDLAKKYKKRKEVFHLMFKKMGIIKGEAVEAATKKLAEVIETRAVSEVEETIRKIAVTRDAHYKMSAQLARWAWDDLVRAKQAGLDISELGKVMTVYKMAGDVFGSSRRELFAILNVDKHDQEEKFDDLPELTVRELTGVEITLLQNQSAEDDMGINIDPGTLMLPDDDMEGV